jgi:RNA polymerase sigma-70 factor (ECF subfamily)
MRGVMADQQPNGAAERRFDALYQQQYARVLAYCLRRSQSDADAADAAAETFAVAWRRSADLPDEPLPWLYGVARRVLANQRRADQRRELLRERLREHAPREDAQTASSRSTHPVQEAFTRLSVTDRELLALAAWEGLAPRQIAQVTNTPAALVSVRLHRAKKRLRAQLGKLPDGSLAPAARPVTLPLGKPR